MGIDSHTTLAGWLDLEQIILSGQMPEADLAARMAQDQAFASWLTARATARQSTPPVVGIQQAVDEVRVGTFQMTVECLERDAQTCLAILDGCIVIACEPYRASRPISYTAIHPSFDPVPDALAIPQYTALLDARGVRTWRRVSPPQPIPAEANP